MQRVAGHRGKRTAAALGVALTLLLLLAGLAWARRVYHFRSVAPGKLYRSGTLTRAELERVLARTGIRTIVNLRSEAEYALGSWYADEVAFAATHGVELVAIPLRPDSPPTPEQVAQFLAVVTDPARQPVLVHCEVGAIRTGAMVAAYQVLVEGKDCQWALQEMPLFGHHLSKRPAIRDFILGLPRLTP